MKTLHSVHPFEGYDLRFTAYCQAVGYESPIQQWAADRCNVPYITWTAKKLAEWKEQAGVSYVGPQQQAQFDAWLGSKA
jgi:hypothetical protein